MSKKNNHQPNKKDLIEFEIKNSGGVGLFEAENPGGIGGEESETVQEAEIEKAEENKTTIGANPVVASTSMEAINEEGSAREKPVTEKQKNRKVDTYIEFLLIFILGVLIGVAIKTEAEKRITIGFDDYQMSTVRQDFDINKIQFEVTKKSAEENKAQDAGEPIENEESSQVEQ